MWLDIVLSRYSPEQYRTAVSRARNDPVSLTPEDKETLADVHYARFTYYENLHFQHQLGLITPEEWSAAMSGLAGDISVRHCVHDWWQEERRHWRKSFALKVDELISSLPLAPCNTSTGKEQQEKSHD